MRTLSSVSHRSPAILRCVRVLLVEDNEAMADAVQRGLVAEGFAVDHVCDGLDGLWRAREFSYDVIVLDIMLPGMNGYEVCRTLRSEGVTTPILMLTAKDGDYDIAEGLDFGADDYLTKPFAFVVLVARVRALARRANPVPGQEVISVGSLSVDPVRHRCLVNGRALELTPREFSLLETLARRPDQPMTRTELMDHVWGADYDGGSNVVDVYIGYLRKKLEADGDPKMIDTVRGIGYRLVTR